MRNLKIAVAILAVVTAALAASTIRLNASLEDERIKTRELTELRDAQLALLEPMGQMACQLVVRRELSTFLGEWVQELTEQGMAHIRGTPPGFADYANGPDYRARLKAYETYLQEVDEC